MKKLPSIIYVTRDEDADGTEELLAWSSIESADEGIVASYKLVEEFTKRQTTEVRRKGTKVWFKAAIAVAILLSAICAKADTIPLTDIGYSPSVQWTGLALNGLGSSVETHWFQGVPTEYIWCSSTCSEELTFTGFTFDAQGPIALAVFPLAWLRSGVIVAELAPITEYEQVFLQNQSSIQHTPEPASFVLLAIGALGVAWRARKR